MIKQPDGEKVGISQVSGIYKATGGGYDIVSIDMTATHLDEIDETVVVE